ncbi:uncharacterized protein CANTADRAFT_250704 [Suhomyces tanzawaensis NRRL Y-17324]|uniref:Uncharacterized protein n=1 Tax=Suhomyces tanzawaensis NRRL Y-17324 TaxID=984487 RepID=A0A1E4SI91_9ASCO|nr:uncharacterized protein CANTADRAFT_250704 [Suhomyces tanzawaensis NRRL Y-17324]ODV79238.1 hypothetical protein CANTADRAFT_250704 [Suhomyces tanzawaensis NRRL Y-17324]
MYPLEPAQDATRTLLGWGSRSRAHPESTAVGCMYLLAWLGYLRLGSKMGVPSVRCILGAIFPEDVGGASHAKF